VSFRDAQFDGARIDTLVLTLGTESSLEFDGASFSSGEVSIHRDLEEGCYVSFANCCFAGADIEFMGEYTGGQMFFDGAFSAGTVDFNGSNFAGTWVNFPRITMDGGTLDLSKIRMAPGHGPTTLPEPPPTGLKVPSSTSQQTT
jgi:hypothetical protein